MPADAAAEDEGNEPDSACIPADSDSDWDADEEDQQQKKKKKGSNGGSAKKAVSAAASAGKKRGKATQVDEEAELCGMSSAQLEKAAATALRSVKSSVKAQMVYRHGLKREVGDGCLFLCMLTTCWMTCCTDVSNC